MLVLFCYNECRGCDMTEVYHGSIDIVFYPEIRITKYTKDFSWGFYCTNSYSQASRWAKRRNRKGYVNRYEYIPDLELSILHFDEMTDEWLDFIAACRAGKTHPYDIVEGPMADDAVWNYVNDFLSGNISRQAFWELAKFKHPTNQISFHTARALTCLKYLGSDEVYE